VTDPARHHRGTVFVEDATVVEVIPWPEEQYVIRLHSPRCAAKARAGSFIHLQCDDAIPMRRPLSIMRVNAAEGWIDVLFKIVGPGLKALANRKPGDVVSSMGPIGRGFEPDPERPHCLLIGGGVGIPPMVFLAEELAGDSRWDPLALMGSELPFPFERSDSNDAIAGIEPGVNSAMSLLESWKVPSRLASLADYPGSYRGYVTELAREHLTALSTEQRDRTSIFACGPTPMLAATARLAADFSLPCQVSLEEFMACAIGGCAGCTVRVETPDGPAMTRVCVDGPVFEAATVFP